MYNDAFFHKLAIERCQYNLAQLCAALFIGVNYDQTSATGQTIQALIENLNRDLVMLDGLMEDVIVQDNVVKMRSVQDL
jgi:hypothetical protein